MADNKEKIRQLQAPFDVSDVKYRFQAVSGTQALALPFIDSRALAERLDSVLGAENWYDEYFEWQMPTVQLDPMAATQVGVDYNGNASAKIAANFIDGYYAKSVKCALSISLDGKKFITKQDGAENTDIEHTKGGFSQAFRRSGAKWGIGRYLYNLPDLWIPVSTDKNFGTERIYFKGANYYYNKPDLCKYTGKAGTKPSTEKSAGKTIPENTVHGGPAAIPTADLRDWQTRLSPLAQNNPKAMALIGESAKATDSLSKVSKLLGACYNLLTAGSKEQSVIGDIMQEKNLPEMVVVLKNSLVVLENNKTPIY